MWCGDEKNERYDKKKRFTLYYFHFKVEEAGFHEKRNKGRDSVIICGASTCTFQSWESPSVRPWQVSSWSYACFLKPGRASSRLKICIREAQKRTKKIPAFLLIFYIWIFMIKISIDLFWQFFQMVAEGMKFDFFCTTGLSRVLKRVNNVQRGNVKKRCKKYFLIFSFCFNFLKEVGPAFFPCI